MARYWICRVQPNLVQNPLYLPFSIYPVTAGSVVAILADNDMTVVENWRFTNATTADGGLAFGTERNSVPVTNRARTSSPRRHVLAQTRRTEPQGVNATAKISGTTMAPTSRQRPLAETVRIKHSIQGASGSTMINPDQFSSISSAALRLDKSISPLWGGCPYDFVTVQVEFPLQAVQRSVPPAAFTVPSHRISKGHGGPPGGDCVSCRPPGIRQRDLIGMKRGSVGSRAHLGFAKANLAVSKRESRVDGLTASTMRRIRKNSIAPLMSSGHSSIQRSPAGGSFQ